MSPLNTFEHPHSTFYSKRPTVHTSRGGASNVAPRDKVTSFSQSTGAPTSTTGPHHNSPKELRSFGRGGAGDVYYNSSEWAIFSFDEELECQLRRETEAAPIFHVGRGGAGDMRHPREYNLTKRPSETGSIGSNSSALSETDRATDKSSRRNIEKGWGRVMDISS